MKIKLAQDSLRYQIERTDERGHFNVQQVLQGARRAYNCHIIGQTDGRTHWRSYLCFSKIVKKGE